MFLSLSLNIFCGFLLTGFSAIISLTLGLFLNWQTWPEFGARIKTENLNLTFLES